MIYIGMDDTDNIDSRGTGTLSRNIAKALASDYPIYAVSRHQLYDHPDIPYTTHNSCSVLQVELGIEYSDELFERVREEMMDDFIEGSDPGLVVAHDSQITPAHVAFGFDAKCIVLNQTIARNLAANTELRLEGLGGTEDGVIGALAGVGLAASRYDGRFLKLGSHDLKGHEISVEELLKAGVDEVLTLEGRRITEGIIYNSKGRLIKTCPVGDKVVLFAEEDDGVYNMVSRG